MSLCRYTLLEQGIHHFVLLEGSKEALEAFFESYAVVYAAHTGSDPLRVLMELRGDALPAAEFRRQSADFFSRHPQRPLLRVAYLYDGGKVSMLRTFLELLRLPAQRRFFSRYEQKQALDWLLE
jgi:hypothetical protein